MWTVELIQKYMANQHKWPVHLPHLLKKNQLVILPESRDMVSAHFRTERGDLSTVFGHIEMIADMINDSGIEVPSWVKMNSESI